MGSSLEPTLALKNPIVADFVKRYEAKFQKARPGIFSSQGFDNIMVIMDAIQRTGKLTGDLQKDRDAIRDALKKTSIQLTQGKIEFDKNGQVYTVVPSPVQVQVVDGKPQLFIIYPPERAGSAYQEPLPWDKRKS
jgi:ABC-type branched-subunit amino acid transport system substrate-binding protein